MIFLETDRLILRNVAEEDASVMHDYRNNPLCSKYQRGQTKDMAGIKELIQSRRADVLSADTPCLLAVALKETGEMVGEIVVMPDENTFTLGYTISY
ncbi:MAG: GNAT family N-acetyltransferase, partial [Oscillospiraceae bacterium]|nr:GNAT family N-acetyltransferase [Oscillospiraceae bacterium]